MSTDSGSDTDTNMDDLTNDLQGDGEYLTWLSSTWLPVFAPRMQGLLEPERAYRQWVAQSGPAGVPMCAATGFLMLSPTKKGKTMYTACLVRRDTRKPMAARGNHVYVCSFVAIMWNAVASSSCRIKTLDMFVKLCGYVASSDTC